MLPRQYLYGCRPLRLLSRRSLYLKVTTIIIILLLFFSLWSRCLDYYLLIILLQFLALELSIISSPQVDPFFSPRAEASWYVQSIFFTIKLFLLLIIIIIPIFITIVRLVAARLESISRCLYWRYKGSLNVLFIVKSRLLEALPIVKTIVHFEVLNTVNIDSRTGVFLAWRFTIFIMIA